MRQRHSRRGRLDVQAELWNFCPVRNEALSPTDRSLICPQQNLVILQELALTSDCQSFGPDGRGSVRNLRGRYSGARDWAVLPRTVDDSIADHTSYLSTPICFFPPVSRRPSRQVNLHSKRSWSCNARYDWYDDVDWWEIMLFRSCMFLVR